LPKLGNCQAAEDALAETFRTVLERIGSYEDQGKGIWAWMTRVATNKAMDMHRVKGRTDRALTTFEGLLAPLRTGAPNPGTALEDRLEAERLSSAVHRVLAMIHPRYRRAIELRFMSDLPRERCAEELAVKVATFDVLILRALRAFRREWDRVAHAEEVAHGG
jgi:RNA polymerase sigma-70 factor (ECF subfamily)